MINYRKHINSIVSGIRNDLVIQDASLYEAKEKTEYIRSNMDCPEWDYYITAISECIEKSRRSIEDALGKTEAIERLIKSDLFTIRSVYRRKEFSDSMRANGFYFFGLCVFTLSFFSYYEFGNLRPISIGIGFITSSIIFMAVGMHLFRDR